MPAISAAPLESLTIVGAGRMGSALAAELRRRGGGAIHGPLRRGESLTRDSIVLLCVPDDEIAAAAALVPRDRLVGHCSGSRTLAVFGDRESFSIHPLMTVTENGAEFTGAYCAVAGTAPRALGVATAIACATGMIPFGVRDEDRAAYHAAASLASNFLVA